MLMLTAATSLQHHRATRWRRLRKHSKGVHTHNSVSYTHYNKFECQIVIAAAHRWSKLHQILIAEVLSFTQTNSLNPPLSDSTSYNNNCKPVRDCFINHGQCSPAHRQNRRHVGLKVSCNADIRHFERTMHLHRGSNKKTPTVCS